MEANDAALKTLFAAQTDVPEHLTPLVTADNISIMPKMVIDPSPRPSPRGCLAVVALVASLHQPDVSNPMTMDPQPLRH